MNIYHYHPETGVFLGQGLADESPLEPGVWLLPAHSVTMAPPNVDENQFAVFKNGAWEVNVIPDPEPEPEPVPEPEPEPIETPPTPTPTPQQLRQWDFQKESDPIFFQVQRGEALMSEWLAKVEEIRQRYPYPPDN